MERRLLQLGSTRLLELGSLRLLELGSVRSGVSVSPVIDIFSLVNTIEDPYAATGVTPPTAQAAAVAERLRVIARNRRRELTGGISLSGIDQIGMELAHLRGILSASAQNLKDLDDGYSLQEVYDPQLGKSLFKKIVKYALPSPKLLKKSEKIVVKKVVKVVKSPAFLAVAGILVNIIPGIGQVASGLLLAAAMTAITAAGYASNAYKARVEKGKAEKKNAAAQAAADAETDAELEKFYIDYGAEYLVPMGYTKVVWDGYTREQRIVVANALAAGKLLPYAPVDTDAAIAEFYSKNKEPLAKLGYTEPVWNAFSKTDKLMIIQAYAENNLRPYSTPQAAVDAVAMDQAMSQVYGHPPGFDLVPPDVKAAADTKTPALVDQINAVGQENFLNTSIKAAGQAGAIGQLYAGSGAPMPAGAAEIAKFAREEGGKQVQVAISQAGDDLRNTAAADNDPSVDKALDNVKSSEFPWTAAIISGSATVAAIGVALALSRRRG